MENFAETYGMSRDEIVRLVGGEEAARKLTMRFIRRYPAVVQWIRSRLKKQRARMMVEAMQTGSVVHGNVGVRVDDRWFIFSYRGTDILVWDTEPDDGTDGILHVHAGAFDETYSTRTQRKVARDAIEEFKCVVQAI